MCVCLCVCVCVCVQVGEKLDLLKRQYDEKLAQKEELRRKSEDMELKLDRAAKLVSGLAGERSRWEETVVVRSTHTHTHRHRHTHTTHTDTHTHTHAHTQTHTHTQ